MASRRILSNSNLAPIQEVAVNPYNSFNSDSINKLTRIVSGGKDKDVVVNGLDINSFTNKKWYASNELLPALDDSSKWTGSNYYCLNETKDNSASTDPVIHLELPHQQSYGFSYIECRLDDSCVYHLYKSSYEKIYEVSFTLDFGTPKTIVAKINDCEVAIDHPEPGKRYSIPLTKYFKNDTREKGLVFKFGAILDGADPECKLLSSPANKTYIVVSHISLKMKGYEFPEFARTPGPIERDYALYGIHPTHILDIDPGVAIKDDVMIEEMAPSIDKFKRFKLDLFSRLSWIKNNPYTSTDFNNAGDQYAYQCNDNGDVYRKRDCRYDSQGRLIVSIKDNSSDPLTGGKFHDVYPTDDIVLTRDIKGNLIDIPFVFQNRTITDEFENFTLHCDGSILDNVTTYSNTVIVCFRDDENNYHVIGYKIGVIKSGKGVTASEIAPVTPLIKEIDRDEQAPNILFDNGSSFDIQILSYRLPKKISDYPDWQDRIIGFISNGPTKVSGQVQCYNNEAVQWGYVVLYYAYFKNPNPNTSYIGLIRESDLELNRDDYLVLAKVRFIDPYTVDIISYEDRQCKQIPTSQEIEYFSTCEYPEIWSNDIPDTVTDAINELALFDHNFARMIRFKHDYNAPIETTFQLANPRGRTPNQTPFVHINDEGHLERKIRIDKTKIVLKSVNELYKRLLPTKEDIPEDATEIIFDSLSSDYIYSFKKEDSEDEWRIRFNPNLNDIPLASEYGLDVKAAMGKYDGSKIHYSLISFSDIGPFRFVDIDNGTEVCVCDWLYFDEILEYPTSPKLSLDSQTLLYPTAPYSTRDAYGKFVDVDNGDLKGYIYKDDDLGYKGGRFLVSYDDPTVKNGESILNSKENHFSYLTFRNRLLISNYFLRMLDLLPKKSVGKKPDGNYALESLIDNRVLIGADSEEEPGNVHIESTDIQLSDEMTNGNLLKSEIHDGVSIIKSSEYAVPNKKTGDLYDYVNDENKRNYHLIDEALITSKIRNGTSTDIISTKYTITAKGNGSVLTGAEYPKNDLIQIQSTKHYISDDFINGNIIRARVDANGDTLESTQYAIPNVATGSGGLQNLKYDFTNDAEKQNYELKDEALLISKKRNDNTTDIISSRHTIRANGRGHVIVSNPTASGLISLESSRHYISDDLKNGNLIIAENPCKDDSTSDMIKSGSYSIPDTKIGISIDPLESEYSYSGNGSYKLTDNAILTSKTRSDGTVDIISSKYTITAGGDKKIVISEYQNESDKHNSLIEIKSSDFTLGDVAGHWYEPKVELRCDSWWNNGKPRIVVVIDTVHNFIIKFSQIVKLIHDQIVEQYCYGDGNIEFTENDFNSLFNTVTVDDKRICDITVVMDLTTGNERSKYFSEKDGYSVLEALCKSKLILVNDCEPIALEKGQFRPYIRMNFDYSDSIKSEGGNIHYDSNSNLIYGFDTTYEFEGKTSENYIGSRRSAEHLHSEPLVSVSDKWKLIPDYDKQDKNIIWVDNFRGYNNTKIYDDDKVVSSQMNLYPVDDDNDLNDVSALAYDPESTNANSGYGYCRGPLNYIFAGNKGEYTFNHVKTHYDPVENGVVYPVASNGTSLFTCTKCTDVIYGEAKYYIVSSQF